MHHTDTTRTLLSWSPSGRGSSSPLPAGRGHGERESLLPNHEPTCEVIFLAGTPACGAVWGRGWRQCSRGGVGSAGRQGHRGHLGPL